ncbi:uncharacterized protein B0T15DRAFT_568578 [Chaetomium strumarium]|uniref:Flavin reductase like domain-containing protein n=1 Tax=Chaetomium strumarium TaxID=1170767 RepID=A0AAJ0GS42_9PEZI|nr:hypothetical protein B0T15DRAFT_568578 [Chaetomium strumarium]
MLYQPGKTAHNLPFDPFKACVVPRPIGWISTTSPRLTFDPPYVMFSVNQTPHHHDSGLSGEGEATRKDTVRNIEATGKFAWNLAMYDLREAVNITAQQVPPGVDEFQSVGLEKEFTSCLPGDLPGSEDGKNGNPVPMVKASPVKFECVYHSTLRLPGNGPVGTVDVVIGRVAGFHIADWALNERGRLDVRRTRPIARCGYYEYAVVGGEGTIFEMVIPGLDELTLAGLEGYKEKVDKWMGAKEKAKL